MHNLSVIRPFSNVSAIPAIRTCRCALIVHPWTTLQLYISRPMLLYPFFHLSIWGIHSWSFAVEFWFYIWSIFLEGKKMEWTDTGSSLANIVDIKWHCNLSSCHVKTFRKIFCYEVSSYLHWKWELWVWLLSENEVQRKGATWKLVDSLMFKLFMITPPPPLFTTEYSGLKDI
jgi:hypothetical protein